MKRARAISEWSASKNNNKRLSILEPSEPSSHRLAFEGVLSRKTSAALPTPQSLGESGHFSPCDLQSDVQSVAATGSRTGSPRSHPYPHGTRPSSWTLAHAARLGRQASCAGALAFLLILRLVLSPLLASVLVQAPSLFWLLSAAQVSIDGWSLVCAARTIHRAVHRCAQTKKLLAFDAMLLLCLVPGREHVLHGIKHFTASEHHGAVQALAAAEALFIAVCLFGMMKTPKSKQQLSLMSRMSTFRGKPVSQAQQAGVLAVLGLPLVVAMFCTVNASDEGLQLAVAALEPAVSMSAVDVEACVAAFFRPFLHGKARETPLVLHIGARTWDYTARLGALPARAADRLQMQAAGGGVVVLGSRLRANQQDALQQFWINEMLLQLVVVALLLDLVGRRALLLSMKRVIRRLWADEGGNLFGGYHEQDADASPGETAVNKLNRITNVEAWVKRGSTLFTRRLQDTGTDMMTQQWLQQLATDATDGNPDSRSSSTLRSEHVESERMAMLAACAAANQAPAMESPKPGVSRRGSMTSVDWWQLLLQDTAVKEALALREQMLAVDVDLLESWDFDVFFYTRQQLVAHLCMMAVRLGLTQAQVVSKASLRAQLEADPPKHPAALLARLSQMEQQLGFANASSLAPLEQLWCLFTQVSLKYNSVPYHNFWHVVDVAHTTFLCLSKTRHRTAASLQEMLALLVAAVSHDLEHPGVNNAYLIASRHPLARLYNDNSVLENSHISALYNLMAAQPELDVFAGQSAEGWRDARKLVIHAILHTDMTYHFPLVSQVEVFRDMYAAEIASMPKGTRRPAGQEDFVPTLFTSATDRLFLMALFLHCADLSNAVKPMSIVDKWTSKVLQEFFEQGDKERAQGLPVSPMMDRATTSPPLSQINFIEFIVAPLFAEVAKVFPELACRMSQLHQNRRTWQERYLSSLEADPALLSSERGFEKEKAAARYTAFREKYGLREEKGSKGSSTPSGGASRNSFMSTPGMPFTIPESGALPSPSSMMGMSFLAPIAARTRSLLLSSRGSESEAGLREAARAVLASQRPRLSCNSADSSVPGPTVNADMLREHDKVHRLSRPSAELDVSAIAGSPAG